MRKSFYLIQGQEIWMTTRITIMWYMLIQQVILENLLLTLKISSRRERGHSSKYDGNLKMKEFYASLDPISLIVEDVDICVEVLGSKVTEFNSLLCRGLATQIHVYATAMSNKLKGLMQSQKQ